MKIWLRGLLNRLRGKNKKKFHLTRITRCINSPEEAERFFRKVWDKDLLTKQEQVYALFVDEQHRYLDHQLLHTGGICETVIDVRVLFKHALNCYANGIFIAHNHPRANLEPSDVDIEMTNQIRKGCEIMKFDLWDHVILGKSGYFSFAEHGLLEN